MSEASAGPLRLGDPAPDFTLPSTAGTAVTLSAFRGRKNVLLIDRQGVLRWQHTEAKLGDRRDDAELLRVIGSL